MLACFGVLNVRPRAGVLIVIFGWALLFPICFVPASLADGVPSVFADLMALGIIIGTAGTAAVQLLVLPRSLSVWTLILAAGASIAVHRVTSGILAIETFWTIQASALAWNVIHGAGILAKTLTRSLARYERDVRYWRDKLTGSRWRAA